MTEDRRQKKVLFLICAVLAIATFIAYEPIRYNGFVGYDDNAYITDNPNVNGGITLQSVIWAFTKTYLANWYPLTWLSHMLDCEIYGLNPVGHHLTNVLIHTVSGLLLFWVLLKMTGTMWPSAFVAAVFALHPLHVESVAWAVERKDVLSGLFWMLTILAYAYYAELPNIKRYVMVMLAFVMAMMAKPMTVTLPFVLLLLDYWPLGRFGGMSPVLKTVPLRRLLAEKAPLFGLSAILSVIAFIAQKSSGAVSSLELVPLDYRIVNMFLSYIRYIEKTIWPSGLAVIYPRSHIILLSFGVVISVFLFVMITVFCIYTGRRRKYAAVGWLWYIGTLVPVIGLVQIGSQAMADRYMYLPMTGLIIIIAWGVRDFISNRPQWRVVTAVLAGFILLFSVILTRTQVRYWQNSMTLFGHALEVTSNNRVAENGYGCALWKAGRLNEAVLHLSNAVRISPTSFDSWNNLGKVLLIQGKYNDAIACFNEIIKLKQETEEVYENLGTAYAQLGMYEQAIQNLTKAIELNPDNAKVINNLAWLLATNSDVSAKNADKAVELARRACEITRYKEPNPLDTLAVAYAAGGKFADARATAEKALDAAKAAKQEYLAVEIQSRLELYKAGRPYRGK